jgi:hypothetical protein
MADQTASSQRERVGRMMRKVTEKLSEMGDEEGDDQVALFIVVVDRDEGYFELVSTVEEGSDQYSGDLERLKAVISNSHGADH